MNDLRYQRNTLLKSNLVGYNFVADNTGLSSFV